MNAAYEARKKIVMCLHGTDIVFFDMYTTALCHSESKFCTNTSTHLSSQALQASNLVVDFLIIPLTVLSNKDAARVRSFH
jgi:hypothetical protein